MPGASLFFLKLKIFWPGPNLLFNPFPFNTLCPGLSTAAPPLLFSPPSPTKNWQRKARWGVNLLRLTLFNYLILSKYNKGRRQKRVFYGQAGPKGWGSHILSHCEGSKNAFYMTFGLLQMIIRRGRPYSSSWMKITFSCVIFISEHNHSIRLKKSRKANRKVGGKGSTLTVSLIVKYPCFFWRHP